MSVTATILSVEKLGGGLKRVTSSLLLDASMPAGGYDVTAAMFGLSYFQPSKAGTSLLDPVVKSVSGAVLMARIIAKKLIPSYPSGGATAAPGTIADPLLTSGAGLAGSGASTASAVDATRPTVALTSTATTPGRGKDLPTGADCAAVTVVATATGY